MSPNVREFLQALPAGSVKKAGQGWVARCPAHDDQRESLSIDEGKDGKLLLRCFAGCTFEQIIAEAGVRREPVRSREVTPVVRGRSGVVAEYDYTDEHGALLYQVVRYEPKDFRQRRPDGKGGWIYSTKDVRHVLYRLPAIIEAVALNHTIYLCEGEKDVDNLVALGLDATTADGGAKKVWLDAHTDVLRGAHVVVLPHNDPPGEQHGQEVAAALTAATCRVHVLRFPDLPEHGDVSDWLESGGSREALERLVDAWPVWPLDAEGFAPVCALDIGDPQPIEWTIADFWTHGDIGLVVGDGGSYKSTLALHLALAVAGGRRAFNRFEVPRARPVLLVSEEDPEHVLVGRARALLRGHGWNDHDVLRNLHVVALKGVSLSDPAVVQRLRMWVTHLDAGLVVLDPLHEMIAADENSASEMRAVVKAIRSLTRDGRTSVIVVHHTGKMREGQRQIDRVRGSSSLHGAARCLYAISAVDTTVSVECIKLSRAAKLEKFVVDLHVESDEANRAIWRAARLDYVRANVAALTRAEEFVLEQLDGGAELGSAELKRAAKGSGVSAADVSRAIKTLELTRRITFDPAAGQKKPWRRVDLAENSPATPARYVADLARTLPGKVDPPPDTLPAPLGARSGGSAGQPDDPTEEAA